MRELFRQVFICGGREVVAIGEHPVETLLVHFPTFLKSMSLANDFISHRVFQVYKSVVSSYFDINDNGPQMDNTITRLYLVEDFALKDEEIGPLLPLREYLMIF